MLSAESEEGHTGELCLAKFCESHIPTHFHAYPRTTGTKPIPRGVADLFGMVKDLNVIFEKGPGRESVPNDADGHAPMWKKKSIFCELEYWKVHDVRSAIDVMHMTKNICVNILGFLGLYGKSKDTPEAREDQQCHKGRDGMHAGQFEGLASYALTKEEKEIFLKSFSVSRSCLASRRI